MRSAMTEPNDLHQRELRFRVSPTMELVADAWGDPSRPPVILLHGGGQTRHAWGGTAEKLAACGFYALSVDQRGHGDSRWCSQGEYGIEAYVGDLHAIMDTLKTAPALVGASLGGMVLVDITPRVESQGIQRIIQFMTAHPEGYASLEDAARAIAEYLPHRPRPRSFTGLAKNLRLGADGRYRWHWDPAFLTQASSRTKVRDPERLTHAAGALALPTLLVRGRMSDIVSEETAREFLQLVPHAEYVDVADAAHMVAGDQNDVFADAVVGFLRRRVAAADGSRPSDSR
jgi:non-heme chloroperoxidase